MDSILYPQEKYFSEQYLPLESYPYRQGISQSHYHDFHELVIVLNGRGQHVTEGESYNIFRGDVFVIRPFIEHTYQDMHDLQIENILFIPEKLDLQLYDVRNIPGYFALFDIEPNLRKKHAFKSRLTLDDEQLTVVNRIIAQLNSELKLRSEGFQFMAVAIFMQLIGFLSRCYSHSPQKHSQNLLKVSAMIDFIETEFRNNITLEDIAATGKTSVRTATRIFKEAFEISPITYLLKTRLNNARKLLKESPATTVSEAAFQSGFNDSNYFAKQFRNIFGESPSEYKKHLGSTSDKQ
jgi:AraC-like DNA-binding protein